MKRCAIYARYSSDLQSPTSIEDQFRLCRAYAERQEWTVVATFEDAARSGFGTEHRPAYQRFLAAALAPAPAFDVVLVEDLSRLTREIGELMRLAARLRLKGVELVGVSDGIVTGRQGAKVQLAVKGLMNELYLDDLRDKTHRGLSGRVTRGFSAGGRIFGYRTVPADPAAHASRRDTTRGSRSSPEKPRSSAGSFASLLGTAVSPPSRIGSITTPCRFPRNRRSAAPRGAGGPAPPSGSSCGTKSTPASGSGISPGFSRTRRPDAADACDGPRASGCARTGPTCG